MKDEEHGFMRKLAGFVVDHRRWFLALFAALAVFTVFSVRWIQVEEDITYYLPDDAEAKQGLFLMEDEFTTYGTARVMVKGVSPAEAQAISDALAEDEDVVLVQYDETDAHYRDGNALFDLTFSDTADSRRSIDALARIEGMLFDRDTTVWSEIGFSLSGLVTEQMKTVLIFVVIVVLSVLLFTSSTYAEIPVMVLTFLAAAVVNIGTNFLMGTISFVSNSVGIVLQLALSVDYAIIFCNRYKEEHERLGIRDAVVKALSVSIPEIFASSLTTIAGLTAMTLMKFRLGVDLGMTLIKAIVCSLLTVFLFMPALLMLFGKAMDKTRHRRFVPKVPFVGKFAYATRFVIPILFVLLVAGGYAVCQKVQYAYSMDLVPAFRQTEREQAEAEINEVFGSRNTIVMIVPSGNTAAEKLLLDELSDCPEVKSAIGLANIEAEGCILGDEVDAAEFARLAEADETLSKALFAYYAAEQGEHQTARDDLAGYKAPILDVFLFLRDRMESGAVELTDDQVDRIRSLYEDLRPVRDQLSSENYSRMILELNLPVQSEETFRFLDRIHQIAARYFDKTVLTGDSVSALGFRDSFAADNTVVGLMSLGLVMVILFFTFRSFGMPLLLILVIQGSIWINFAVAALQRNYVFFLCYLIVGAIQMGANIDYAIVASSRYRELRHTMEKREAIIETMNLAFPTVITSGLMMVCAGFLVGFGVSQCIIAGMGYYVGTGTSISLALILFALPQVLLLGESFVTATTLRTEKSRLLRFLARNRLRLGGALLALACLAALIAAPLALRSGEKNLAETEERALELRSRTDALRDLAEELSENREAWIALQYDFAEQLVTDEVGSAQLAEGERQLAEGEAQYDSGLAAYNEGAAQIESAQQQYDSGAAELAAAQAQYDAGLAAYQEGKAQVDAAREELAAGQARYDAAYAAYTAGKAQYEAALQELAAGQAAYDAGLASYTAGQAQLAAAQETYNQGLAKYQFAKSAMDAIEPLYNAAIALQQRVDELQAKYDAAVAQGNLVQAALLQAELNAARFALESKLLGKSIQDLIAQYNDALASLAAAEQELSAGKQALDAGNAALAAAEQELAAGKQKLDDGYAQAEAAERELAAAEQELAAGKQKLDDGYAQLADAEQQLAAAEQELAAGKQALEDGYARLAEGGRQLEEGKAELADAKQQLDEGDRALTENREKLEEGRAQLAENLSALNESLAALDAMSGDADRLTQGLRLLHNEPEIHDRISAGATPFEILDVAALWSDELRRDAAADRDASRLAAILALAAVLSCVTALCLSRGKKTRLAGAILSACGGLLALAALLFRPTQSGLAGSLLLYAAIALLVAAALFSELLFLTRRKEDSTPAA